MAVSYTGKPCTYCAKAGVAEFDGLCATCAAEARFKYSEHLWCRFCGRGHIRDRDTPDDMTCGMPGCEQVRRGGMNLSQLVQEVETKMTGFGGSSFSMKLIR